MQKAGQSDTPVTEEEVSQLFAPKCTKTENGTDLFTSSSALPGQLDKARKAVGKWKIKVLWMAPSEPQKACILQFTWVGELMTQEHTTMVGLFLDDTGKISNIREVYNEYQKKTLGEK